VWKKKTDIGKQNRASVRIKFFYYYCSNKTSNRMESIGELEAEVLEVLKKKGQATAAEVLGILQRSREIAYTTVSTTLDRLYRKKLLERKALVGPGGTKYLFSLSRDERRQAKIIEATIDRLTDAFGETAYSAIYKKLDSLPDDELALLKKQVDKARKKRSA
jgi:predicted transcriptional regulator